MNEGASVLLIVVIFWCICGGICSAIAASKGRNPVGWFFAGLMPYFTGIILIACLPNLKEKKAREEALDRENRRLREQLYQEQMKAETFRQHTIERLDVHDVHLGVDTRSTSNRLGGPQADAPLNLGFDGWSGQGQQGQGQQRLGDLPFDSGANQDSTAPPPGMPTAKAAQAAQPARQWFYGMSGQTFGPISEPELAEYIRQRHIKTTTLVWTQQLGDWRPAGEIAHLQQWFRA